jgi:predicted SAM-dependent methyltransferase
MITRDCKERLTLFVKHTKIFEVVTESRILSWIFDYNNKKLLEKNLNKTPLRLHLGCGAYVLEGWINIDAMWRPKTLVLKLPHQLKLFNKNTVEYIYASHFLEHLQYPKEVIRLLTTCYQLLKPGGVLRVGVPDIEIIVKAYIDNDETFFAKQAQFHPSWCTTKLDHLIYALQQEGEHKHGYDFETLQKVLLKAGFQKVIKSHYGESKYEELRIDYREDLKNLTLYAEANK